METRYEGGCLCGAIRYEAMHEPDRVTVCHCRYCQLRSGSSFGSLVYFDAAHVRLLQGETARYSFISESGHRWETAFCSTCATTLFIELEKRPGLIGVAYGTFDPPTFHFPITREVFTRSKAGFVGAIPADEQHETIADFTPGAAEDPRLRGG